MLKFVVLCAVVAVAQAGYLAPAAHAIGYAAPAISYAAPVVSYAPAPAISYTRTTYVTPSISYAAPAIHAAPVAATSPLAIGYKAAAPFAFGAGYSGFGVAAPLGYTRAGYAGLGYAGAYGARAIW